MGCFSSSMVIPQTKFFKSDEKIRVYIDENSHVIYEPLDEKRRVGVIFYPGFKANHKRYSNIAFNLAKNGYFTVLCSMPCNTAFLAPNRASEISESYSRHVEKWVIGGHSLGGIMATKFIHNNYKSQNPKKTFSGLFLLGKYLIESV
jgi:alpha-beta hydrolase superfamily lysophospholipase